MEKYVKLVIGKDLYLKPVCRQTAHVDAIIAWKVSCDFISGVDNWTSFGNCIIGRHALIK